MPRKKGGKYRYVVYRQVRGGQSSMLSTTSRKEAVEHFKKHPRAIFIQKYNRKSGLTAGTIEPGKPQYRVKRKAGTYTIAYKGPHNKRFANSVSKSFRKDGIRSFIKKWGKKGYVIYVHHDDASTPKSERMKKRRRR